jgi:acetyl esterase/lipase
VTKVHHEEGNVMLQIRSAALTMLTLLILGSVRSASAEGNTRVRDVVYGRKFGLALTMDVWKPAKPNGLGVIFLVSGAFKSEIDMVDSGFFGPVVFKPFLDRGYTLFLVCHGAQPKFTVSEIVPDIHRAVRFIRVHANDYGVSPERLGIMGASSGGFLALAIGTAGGPGDQAAKDPVDRASSRVQAVACFSPPSDLVNYGRVGRSIVEYEPVKFVWHAFGVQEKPKAEQIEALRKLSPLAAVTRDTAPTLIIHGDADPLVPYEQSERFIAKLAEHKVLHRLIARTNAGHGWPDMGKDHALLADWFDQRLRPAVGNHEKDRCACAVWRGLRDCGDMRSSLGIRHLGLLVVECAWARCPRVGHQKEHNECPVEREEAEPL